MAKTLLIIEDDSNIRELLRLYLEQEGYVIESACDGAEGLRAFKRIHPDLVLLDVMMPNMDGWQVIKEIRAASKTPVIMLTAKSETFDKVSGLELGADDYISKPFEMREVIARIHAVMRRFDDDAPAKLEFDNLVIDKESYNIVVKGKKMEIPPKEIELLYFWPRLPTGCSPGPSCWTTCGGLIISAIPGRWTSTSSACGKSSPAPAINGS